MINNIASRGVHAADLAALRQNRAKKTEPAQDTAVEAGKAQKPAHPAHPHGHIPPGLARAAEKIASKIFARADADGSGTVTQQELSAVHSRHARTLASSDLFQPTTTETPTDAANDAATGETATSTDTTTETGATSDTATTEITSQAGVTEAQLKEALTKFFYAKVGVTYTPPPATIPPTTEAPEPTESTNTATPPVDDSVSDEPVSNQTFIAVA